MTQVSRKPLPKHVENALLALFFKSLARVSNTSDIEKFLNDLLGPAERTMLAKRLGIAILLAKGYQYNAIKDSLNVSQETIARVNMNIQYQGEGYAMVIAKALRDEKINALFKKVEDATIGVLPMSSLKKALQNERRIKRKRETSIG